MSIKISPECIQSECLPCPIHRWFPKGVFLHERMELRFERNVMLFRFFHVLRKNTISQTCGILVKILTVAVLLYAYNGITNRKCGKDSVLTFAYVTLLYAG